MAFSDYSLTPSANTTIAGQSIAPGGPPSAVGPGIRQIMTDGRILSDKVDAFASVRETRFAGGAKGDGSTNDTAAFTAAMSTARRVLVPAGTYIVDHAIIPDNTEIYGEPGAILRPPVGGPTAGLTPGVHGALLYARSGSSGTQVTNIKIRDLELYGRVADASGAVGFSQFDHLIHLGGVRSVTVQRVKFRGFRGDGFCLAAGEQGGDRSNFDVILRDCEFDGLNNDNRNSISVITGTRIRILDCKFSNSTRSNMPGAIDFEPDALATYQIDDCQVRGCSFFNIGGNVAAISLPTPTAAGAPIRIAVNLCVFKNYVGSGSEFHIDTNRTAAVADQDESITVTNCEGSYGVRPFTIYNGKGVRFEGNTWQDYSNSALIGFPSGSQHPREVVVRDRFVRCGTAATAGNPVITVATVDDLAIGSTLIDCGTGGANSIGVQFVGGASTKVNLSGLRLVDPNSHLVAGVQVVGGYTVDSAGNRLGNADFGGRTNGLTAADQRGSVTLVAGVATVAAPGIGATSRVIVHSQADGGTPGLRYAVTRTAGTSFTITAKDGSNATQTADTSTLGYRIEPAEGGF